MIVVVSAIGIAVANHVVKYLQNQLILHGIEHTQQISSKILPYLERAFQEEPNNKMNMLGEVIESYRALGFRILIVDRLSKLVVIDSQYQSRRSWPIASTWLSRIQDHEGGDIDILKDIGSGYTLDQDQHNILLWLAKIETGNKGDWLLVTAKDQIELTSLMEQLHQHLDIVLLSTYLLIAIFGYLIVRGIGRSYEFQLERKLNERTQSLEDAHKKMLLNTRLATIGQTATILTHEMRNPLASIKLALSGFKNMTELKEREQRRIGLVLGEVDRLDDLLSETLDYVRPIKISDQMIDFNKLILKVLAQQQPVIDNQAIDMQYQPCEDDTHTYLDNAQIYQVILNLVKNAIEASETGDSIKISLNVDGDELVFQISNEGEIKDEVMKTIFDPFFTTKPKGTGMGLGLVKRVVEEHKGQVFITSSKSAGVVVRLFVPLLINPGSNKNT